MKFSFISYYQLTLKFMWETFNFSIVSGFIMCLAAELCLWVKYLCSVNAFNKPSPNYLYSTKMRLNKPVNPSFVVVLKYKNSYETQIRSQLEYQTSQGPSLTNPVKLLEPNPVKLLEQLGLEIPIHWKFKRNPDSLKIQMFGLNKWNLYLLTCSWISRRSWYALWVPPLCFRFRFSA